VRWGYVVHSFGNYVLDTLCFANSLLATSYFRIKCFCKTKIHPLGSASHTLVTSITSVEPRYRQSLQCSHVSRHHFSGANIPAITSVEPRFRQSLQWSHVSRHHFSGANIRAITSVEPRFPLIHQQSHASPNHFSGATLPANTPAEPRSPSAFH
jgi:hypothetical protein